jgi:hypothetical protein
VNPQLGGVYPINYLILLYDCICRLLFMLTLSSLNYPYISLFLSLNHSLKTLLKPQLPLNLLEPVKEPAPLHRAPPGKRLTPVASGAIHSRKQRSSNNCRVLPLPSKFGRRRNVWGFTGLPPCRERIPANARQRTSFCNLQLF